MISIVWRQGMKREMMEEFWARMLFGRKALFMMRFRDVFR
jgi:hypothetical protein